MEEDDIKKEKYSYLPKSYYINEEEECMALPRSQCVQPWGQMLAAAYPSVTLNRVMTNDDTDNLPRLRQSNILCFNQAVETANYWATTSSGPFIWVITFCFFILINFL